MSKSITTIGAVFLVSLLALWGLAQRSAPPKPGRPTIEYTDGPTPLTELEFAQLQNDLLREQNAKLKKQVADLEGELTDAKEALAKLPPPAQKPEGTPARVVRSPAPRSVIHYANSGGSGQARTYQRKRLFARFR